MHQERNSSIELLRVLSMFFIIVHHICGQGLGFQFYETSGGIYVADMDIIYPTIILIENICIVGVNLFLLISGYYGIKLKWKGMCKFLFICFCFKLFHVSYGVYVGGCSVGLGTVKSICSIITEPTGWFVRCYFLLMICSFFINKALECFSEKEIGIALLMLTFINVYMGFIRCDKINEEGYTLSQFIYIYVIGYALRIHNLQKRIPTKKIAWIWAMTIILNSIAMFILMPNHSKMAHRLLGYNNPLIIISAICVFLVFAKHTFYSKYINTIGAGVFGIYLFHQGNPLWRRVLMPFIADVYNHSSMQIFIGTMCFMIIMVMMIGCSINLCVNKTFANLWKKFPIRKR